jgi:hypothetical protein
MPVYQMQMLNAMRVDSMILMEDLQENISLKLVKMKRDGVIVVKILQISKLKD